MQSNTHIPSTGETRRIPNEDQLRNPRVVLLQKMARKAQLVAISSSVIFLFIIVLAWTGIAQGFDSGVTRSIVAMRNPVFNVLAPLSTKIGGTTIVIVLSLLCIGILAFKKKWLQVEVFLAALVGNAILVKGLKILIHRQRPPKDLWLGMVEDQQSFPSGHSANSIVFWVMLAIIVSSLAKRKTERTIAHICNILAFVMPLCIGLSRIYVAQHWLTDVLGGWTLGIAWVSVVAWFYFEQITKLYIHKSQNLRATSSRTHSSLQHS